MSIELDAVSVDLPGAGLVLDQANATIEGLTVVTGRSGWGASVLLRAVSRTLPPGSLITGRIHTPPRIQTFDGAGDTPERLWRLLDQATGADLLVLDQPLTALAPQHRSRAARAILDRAESGTKVLWAEHLIEHLIDEATGHPTDDNAGDNADHTAGRVWERIDQVIEFVSPGRFVLTPGSRWAPRTLPAPPLMALVRALGSSGDASGVLDKRAASAAPGPSRRHRTGDQIATAKPAQTRLDRPVPLYAGECLGVVSLDGDRVREIDLARRLTAIAAGRRQLPPVVTVPSAPPARALIQDWERIHGLPPGTVAARTSPVARVVGSRPARLHSTGQVAALAWGLAASVPGPRLVVDPTRGLDAHARRHIARSLYDDPRSARSNGARPIGARPSTVLVSSDPEVFTRACHRVLVVAGDRVVADGAPASVAEMLPGQPQLIRAGYRAVRVEELAPDTGWMR